MLQAHGFQGSASQREETPKHTATTCGANCLLTRAGTEIAGLQHAQGVPLRLGTGNFHPVTGRVFFQRREGGLVTLPPVVLFLGKGVPLIGGSQPPGSLAF